VTFTILAADPRTGELGVASFSFVLAVGAGIVHQSRDHGLVAVQALGDPAWANRLLASLDGNRWSGAVAELASEPGFEAGQLAGLSTSGETFAYTGSQTEAFAGAACGRNVCCAANLMAVDSLPALVVDHFRSLDPLTPLAHRLVQSSRHADELGGDVRGRMSAFVKTFPGDPRCRSVDLRVDFHPDAVSRLVDLERIERAHRLVTSALDEHGRYADVAATEAAYELAPESAVTASAYLLARLRPQGPIDAGLPIDVELRSLAVELVRQQPELRERLRRLESAGRLAPGTVDRLDLRAASYGDG
jgi:uncharacterized Ntn-hydrolase superfamily protein